MTAVDTAPSVYATKKVTRSGPLHNWCTSKWAALEKPASAGTSDSDGRVAVQRSRTDPTARTRSIAAASGCRCRRHREGVQCMQLALAAEPFGEVDEGVRCPWAVAGRRRHHGAGEGHRTLDRRPAAGGGEEEAGTCLAWAPASRCTRPTDTSRWGWQARQAGMRTRAVQADAAGQRTPLGRVIRDIGRKLDGLDAAACQKLQVRWDRAERLRSREPKDKGQAVCAARTGGAVHRQGQVAPALRARGKGRIAVTARKGLVVGARSFPGNPYGRTACDRLRRRLQHPLAAAVA